MVNRQSVARRVVLALLIVLTGMSVIKQYTGRAQTDAVPDPVTSSTFGVLTDAEQQSSPETQLAAPQQPLVDGDVYMPFITVSERPLSAAQQIVNLTNQERLRAGCAPLTVNVQLTQAAQGHSQDMALRDFFSHTGSNGSSPADRINATGYRWSRWGENIAAGYSTPAAAMNAWMNSSGHRANILNCNFTEIGVGYYYLANDRGSVNYRHYWTQVFARPR